MRSRFFIALFAVAASGLALNNPIPTEAGLVRGVIGNVSVFRGIPYAAPPVGHLRWKPPQLPEHWKGVRDATKFGAICMQGPSMLRDPALPMSEDCLSLNVWTRARSANDGLPVMVWIHGGFRRGSSSQPQYDGEALARRGVVVISMNYRLGIFGFLAHPALSRESPRRVSGNYGMLDQIAALEWVHRNVHAFGGAPSRVTVFGESAGGFSVLLLNVSPLARGLFARAISESGGFTIPHLRERWQGDPPAEETGEQVAPDLEALRSQAADKVLAASEQRSASISSVFLGLVFRPVVDGWVLPEDPVDAYRAGHVNAAQLIAGTNADEGSLFAGAMPVKTVAELRKFILSRYRSTPAAAEKLVSALSDAAMSGAANGEMRRIASRFIGDVLFFLPTRQALRGAALSGRKAWQYEFTRVNGEGANGSGAFHGSEIPYVFGAFTVAPLGFRPVKAGTYNDEDFTLSHLLQQYWVRFAYSGDPNGDNDPHWPVFNESSEDFIEVQAPPRRSSHLRSRELDLLRQAMASVAR